MPQHARPQQDAGRQLAHHGRQGHPPAQLSPDAGRQQQQRDLDEQQEDRMPPREGSGASTGQAPVMGAGTLAGAAHSAGT